MHVCIGYCHGIVLNRDKEDYSMLWTNMSLEIDTYSLESLWLEISRKEGGNKDFLWYWNSARILTSCACGIKVQIGIRNEWFITTRLFYDNQSNWYYDHSCLYGLVYFLIYLSEWFFRIVECFQSRIHIPY